jgi:hypothetical protein
MATKQELKDIAQIMRKLAHEDPTYNKVKFEMVRLANKIQDLTPKIAVQYPVGREALTEAEG